MIQNRLDNEFVFQILRFTNLIQPCAYAAKVVVEVPPFGHNQFPYVTQRYTSNKIGQTMLKRILTGVLAIVGATSLAGAVHAATPAYTTANVNLRAGPGTTYPVLTTVPNGGSITTYGCLEGYNWCDVSWGAERGWMSASYIQVTYQGQPVIITPAIAPAVGLTVVVFNRAYWDRYYYGRPWYGNWNRYYRPPPPPRAVQPLPPRGPRANPPGPRPPRAVQPLPPRDPRVNPRPRPPQMTQPIQPRNPNVRPPRQNRPVATQPVMPQQPRVVQPRQNRPVATQPRQNRQQAGQQRQRRGRSG